MFNNTEERQEGRISQKEWKELQAWKKARADGSEPTNWELMDRIELDRELVLRHLNRRGSMQVENVIAAGRRLPPTGNWACLQCHFQWTATGKVPAQWWTPASNAFSDKELEEMPDQPAWHCQARGRWRVPGKNAPVLGPKSCGLYTNTIPVPD